MRKSGFTLAEVLITLAIIGVVAALTVPVLIVNYQKQQTITALKKNYSELNTAIQLAEVEYGSIDTWDFSSHDTFMKKYVLPYLNTVPIPRDVNKNYTTYRLSGEVFGSFYIEYALADGTLLKTNIGDAYAGGDKALRYITMDVDLNGNKGPNTYGKDIFGFRYNGPCIHPDGIASNGKCGGNYVSGVFMTDGRDQTESYLRRSMCNKNDSAWSGSACVTLIIMDGWQIKYKW